MKRLATLFILTILVTTAGVAKPKHKVLSGNIAIKGELTKEYQQSPAGTPVIIRRVVKMNNPGENSDNIYYAVEVNGIQETIPSDEMGIIAISAPETDREFWQQIYLKNHLYEYFNDRGYKHKLRQEIDEECLDYLDKLNEIAYQDDYITSYVQGIFSKLNATTIDSNRGESLNIRIIQSSEPDAFMLPNGSMVISTGLLCTLDSEDELAAVIACELGHFVLDHQVNNIYRAERRAKRAAFWADVFATTASAALDVAYWDDNEDAYAVSLVADIGAIASLLSIPATDRLGMKYKTSQEISSDRLARQLLAFKGYNPDGIASALGKIIGYYNLHQRNKDIPRYGSIGNLQKRIEKETPKSEAEEAEMALSNTDEVNNRCLAMLDKAQEMAGTSPNLDIYKQKILLLMRMNKQAQATDILKEYIILLSAYEGQGIEGTEKEWTNKEIGWANQMLDRISRI